MLVKESSLINLAFHFHSHTAIEHPFTPKIDSNFMAHYIQVCNTGVLLKKKHSVDFSMSHTENKILKI